MTLSSRDVVQLIKTIEDLRQRVEDLEALVMEHREFIVSNSFPQNPFEGQLTLRTDQPGALGGGTLYRFNSGTNSWQQVV